MQTSLHDPNQPAENSKRSVNVALQGPVASVPLPPLVGHRHTNPEYYVAFDMVYRPLLVRKPGTLSDYLVRLLYH